MRSFLRDINYGLITRIIGFLLIVEGLFMLTAIPFSWNDCGGSCFSMLLSSVITILTGSLFWVLTKNATKVIGKREGYIIVTFSWIMISLFGALPFYISGMIPSFTDAFFETMSGFTTTGASILTDVEALSPDLLYWRSLTQWLGGMGIIVLSVAILPILGIGGMQLFMAEMPGITKDKLHPRITSTAKRLWGIYILLTIIQILLLWVGEMNFFDSVCHAFTTMATGGFSTRNASIGAFGPYTQYVTIIFMFLAGTNFTLHYFALHGQLRKVVKNEEFRYYALIIIISTVIITAGLSYFNELQAVPSAFRNALFTVVSILTTTGFVTDNYLSWPGLLWMIIFALMFIGGSAGSTGGGMKVIRQLLLFKNSWMELRRSIHPNAVLPVRYNQKSVSQDIIYKLMAFFLMYILVFAMGTILLSLMGLDFETSVGASITCLGNIGPGIGMVGPVDNFAFLPMASKWLLSFMMMLGRLELFTVLILFSPYFWKR
ncbi:MAG: potassium transporter TrkG [Bacteroidales bacterium]|nr:potassium transporter TrkG [Bacteroidales bacterium]